MLQAVCLIGCAERYDRLAGGTEPREQFTCRKTTENNEAGRGRYNMGSLSSPLGPQVGTRRFDLGIRTQVSLKVRCAKKVRGGTRAAECAKNSPRLGTLAQILLPLA